MEKKIDLFRFYKQLNKVTNPHAKFMALSKPNLWIVWYIQGLQVKYAKSDQQQNMTNNKSLQCVGKTWNEDFIYLFIYNLFYEALVILS